MGQATDIGWCDSTGNLQAGCDGCELWNLKADVKICYAGVMTEKYGGQKGWPVSFDKPKLFLERLGPMLKWKDLTGTKRPAKPWLDDMPRVIFLDDMGDTFTESLPLDWLGPVLHPLSESPHQWLLLTKRASRMKQFADECELPRNVWPGVSVTSMKTIARAEILSQIETGGPRWVSFEPLWGPIDIDPTPFDWCVIGGQSGSNRKPCEVQWIADLALLFRDAGKPVFIKQDAAQRPGMQGRLSDELWEIKQMPAIGKAIEHGTN